MVLPTVALMFALASSAQMFSQRPEVSAQKESGFDAIGLPLLSYSSDQGVGFGAVGGAYFYAPGYKPYRHALGLQVFFTTLGIQNHWIRYDAPKLIGRARLETRLEFRKERYAPYYGPGNNTAPNFTGQLTDPFFSYGRTSPGAWLRLRVAPVREGHPFALYGGYYYRYTSVAPFPDSLLASQLPVGILGGSTGQIVLGGLWDTRDDENDPTRGGAEELALRLAAIPTGSRYTYAGVTLSERRFIRLLGSERWIYAQRFTADFMFGDVPFFEWVTLGGFSVAEGVGGGSSVRGLPRGRYAGNVKVVSNSEIRFYPISFELFGAPVKVGGLVFLDLGRVWHPNVADGPWYDWHGGVGGGLRLARRAAVLRFDLAVATDSLRPAIYITFGHMF